MGLSDYVKSRMLEWAAATFNVMGGMNERTRAALPLLVDMQKFLLQLERDDLREDSWAAQAFAAADVRIASPIRCFTRYAATPFTFDDRTIPQGARVAVLFASGNWHERKYPQPDAFRVDHDPKDHLSWGHGVHSCAGKHLARLEMEQLALALSRHARTLQVGESEPLMNNVLQGFAALPAQIQ